MVGDASRRPICGLLGCRLISSSQLKFKYVGEDSCARLDLNWFTLTHLNGEKVSFASEGGVRLTIRGACWSKVGTKSVSRYRSRRTWQNMTFKWL